MTTFSALIKSVTNDCCEYEDSLSPSSLSYSSDFPTCLEFSDTMEIPDLSTTHFFMLNKPALSIENEKEFKQQLRFRYKSEKGKHGGVKPIIKLHNYEDDNQLDIVIKASLYATDKDEEHIFELSGKDCKDGVGWKKLGADYTAKFSTLSVCTKKRDEALKILSERQNGNQPESAELLQAKYKSMQNSVRFCFEAFANENLICEKIFSQPINNQRNAGEMKIVTLSHCSGKASGGDFMIILCDKISKDDTELWFFEENESGDLIWEEQAHFQKADVHHQVAIPFRTPAYCNKNIEKNVVVSIQLRRKSDGYSGAAVKFTYLVDYDSMANSCKRKRQDEIIGNQLNDYLEFYENILSADCEELTDYSNSVLCNQSLEDFSEQNLQIDGIITGQMAELNLTSLEKMPINQQSFHALKLKITSLLLNKDDFSFLKLLPRLLIFQDSDGNALLHLITMEKNCDLKLLAHILQLAPKTPVNISNNFKMTPLHISASQGHVKGIQILMQHGANPSLKNIDGNNCIHLTVAYNQPKCLEELLKPSLDERKRILTKEGEDFVRNYINASNNDGLTALHMAVINESFICTKMLISHKASYKIPDGKSGKTAIHFALEKNSEIRSYLLSQPEIYNFAVTFGLLPNPDKKYCSHIYDYHPKPTECCIEMIEKDDSSEIFSSSESEEEKELHDINEEIEEKLCSILDSNGLWKKMGLYIMDENEIDVIAELQDNPTKIILKEFKKRHEENYFNKLKNILTNDVEFKPIAKQLLLMH